MLWTIIVILVVLWLLGFFGPRESAWGDIAHACFDAEAKTVESCVAPRQFVTVKGETL